MMPDDYAKMKADIQAVIVSWCEGASVDPTSPEQVMACSRPIWNALEESGKLHPEMRYQGFLEAIKCEAILAQHANAPSFFFQFKTTVNVKCEAV
jgi:hypothetical protein